MAKERKHEEVTEEMLQPEEVKVEMVEPTPTTPRNPRREAFIKKISENPGKK